MSRQTSSTNDEKCFTKSGFFGLVAAILILVAGNVAAAFVAVVSHRRAKFLRQKQTGNGLSPVFLPIPSVRERPSSVIGGIRDHLIRLRYPVERPIPETSPRDDGSQKFSEAQPEINTSRFVCLIKHLSPFLALIFALARWRSKDLFAAITFTVAPVFEPTSVSKVAPGLTAQFVEGVIIHDQTLLLNLKKLVTVSLNRLL